MTYDDRQMPDHYGFIVDSHLDALERDYQQVLADEVTPPARRRDLVDEVRSTLATQNDEGAWLEPGFVRDGDGRKVKPPEGVVQSQTFINNVERLCQYLGAK
jgi:hypothetical protein